MLTTVEQTKLPLPSHFNRQYLVSVDPLNKPALDIAHELWSRLPGTVRVLPRGMVYFAGLAPKHLEMFGGVTSIDDRKPVKTFYVGPPPMPEILVGEDGTRTIHPIDPSIVVVETALVAETRIAEERHAAIRDAYRAEEDALKMKFVVAGKIVLILFAIGYLVWYTATGNGFSGGVP